MRIVSNNQPIEVLEAELEELNREAEQLTTLNNRCPYLPYITLLEIIEIDQRRLKREISNVRRQATMTTVEKISGFFTDK